MCLPKFTWHAWPVAMVKKDRLILKSTRPKCPLGVCSLPPLPHMSWNLILSPAVGLTLCWPKKTKIGKRLLDLTRRKSWASLEGAVSPLNLRSKWQALWSLQCHLHRKSRVHWVFTQILPACTLKSPNVAWWKAIRSVIDTVSFWIVWRTKGFLYLVH